MNFLNDKKNLPIIIAIAAVIIIGAVVSGLYFGGVIGQPAQPAALGPSTAPGSTSYPGAPGEARPGMAPAGAPGMPHAQAMPGAPGMSPVHPGMPGGPMGAPGGMRTASLPNVAAGGPGASEHMPGASAMGRGHGGKVIGRRPGAPAGAPGMPGAPGMLGAAGPGGPGGAMVASGAATSTAVVFQGDPTVGPDPFYTKQPPKIIKNFNGLGGETDGPLLGNGDGTLPPIPTTLTVPLPGGGVNGTDPTGAVDAPVVNDQLRRVSGILHSSDGVYAVLETNGVSQTVQPGDDVGGAKVTGIDNDGVTLKTDDNVVLHVPLSDTASVVAK